MTENSGVLRFKRHNVHSFIDIEHLYSTSSRRLLRNTPNTSSPARL